MQQARGRPGWTGVELGAARELVVRGEVEARAQPGRLVGGQLVQHRLEGGVHRVDHPVGEHRLDDVPGDPDGAVGLLPELTVDQDLRRLQHRVGGPGELAHRQPAADDVRARGPARRAAVLVEGLQDLHPAVVGVGDVGVDLGPQPACPRLEGLLGAPVHLERVQRGEVAEHLADLRVDRQAVGDHVVEQEVAGTTPGGHDLGVGGVHDRGGRQAAFPRPAGERDPVLGGHHELAAAQLRAFPLAARGHQRDRRGVGPVGDALEPVVPCRGAERGPLHLGQGADAVAEADLEFGQPAVGVVVERENVLEELAGSDAVGEEVVVVPVHPALTVVAQADLDVEPRPAVDRQLPAAQRCAQARQLLLDRGGGQAAQVVDSCLERRERFDPAQLDVLGEHDEVVAVAPEVAVDRGHEPVDVEVGKVELHVLVGPDVILQPLGRADEERRLQVGEREGFVRGRGIGGDHGQLVVRAAVGSGEPAHQVGLARDDPVAQSGRQRPGGCGDLEIVVGQPDPDVRSREVGEQRLHGFCGGHGSPRSLRASTARPWKCRVRAGCRPRWRPVSWCGAGRVTGQSACCPRGGRSRTNGGSCAVLPTFAAPPGEPSSSKKSALIVV